MMPNLIGQLPAWKRRAIKIGIGGGIVAGAQYATSTLWWQGLVWWLAGAGFTLLDTVLEEV